MLELCEILVEQQIKYYSDLDTTLLEKYDNARKCLEQSCQGRILVIVSLANAVFLRTEGCNQGDKRIRENVNGKDWLLFEIS